jgi:NAD(P)-dependent dehydrogenase (short-subunit alcohol dehydrogenase family)
MSDMSGKVALVTGASSGIGRATAKAFAARGAKVVIAARRADELATLAKAIEAAGGMVSAKVTDISRSTDVEAMVAHALDTYGRLDFAVNNAGFEGDLASITELEEEVWDRSIDTNVKGTYFCLKHEARAMLAGGHGGAIVNVGSVLSFFGVPYAAAYATAKHALIGLTTSVSAELGPQGIRVNIICPGYIDTPMHDRLRTTIGPRYEANLESVHLRRLGQPEEIARSILFLCSDEASYITGTTLTPDGGYSLTL